MKGECEIINSAVYNYHFSEKNKELFNCDFYDLLI